MKQQLTDFAQYWNEHTIRVSSGDCIGGIPNDFYQMPQNYGEFKICQWESCYYTGTLNFAQPLDKSVFEIAKLQVTVRTFTLVRVQYNIDLFKDINVDNTLDVYCFLLDALSHIFNY